MSNPTHKQGDAPAFRATTRESFDAAMVRVRAGQQGDAPALPAGWRIERGTCLDGDSSITLWTGPDSCGEIVYHFRQPIVYAFLDSLATSLRSAVPTTPAGQQGEAREVSRLAEDAKQYALAIFGDGDVRSDLRELNAAIDGLAALATQAAPEARTDKDSLMVAAGERDTLRALLREAREYVVGHRPPMHCVDEHIVVNTMIRRIDAALADGGATHE